jgi:hypothetical protein
VARGKGLTALRVGKEKKPGLYAPAYAAQILSEHFAIDQTDLGGFFT